MKAIKVIFKLIALALILISIPSIYYTLKYMHWITKSKGYPAIYDKEESYDFLPAGDYLIESDVWTEIDSDIENDGDIPNFADAKKLSQYFLNDTIWFKYDLHNNIDINNAMVTLALDIDNNPSNGTKWYGTIDKFNYDIIIGVGYVREGLKYRGYNFIDDKVGHCIYRYVLDSNSLLLGIPKSYIKQFRGSKYVASVGNKGLWNDDLGSINLLEWD